MDKIVGVVSKAPQTRSQNDDDFADRLSSRYTVVLLVVFAVLVSMNQYVRNPITCWAPVHFTQAHTKFMTSYCWVKNTYYLPWNKPIPKYESQPRQMVPYYQWIPFILLGQAVLFYLPTIIWHGLNSKAGVDADSILAAAHTFSRTDRVENRDRTLKMLVNQMDRFLGSRRRPNQHNCCGRFNCKCGFCGRRMGNYLVVLFLISKLFYIANVIGQLFLLNVVLATKYNTFGFDVVRDLIANKDWTEQSYVAFPRVTLCDFKVRGQDMVNVHPYTVQCVLPINLYNESIYVFLWYWMVLVAALSVLSFLIWFIRSLIPGDRVRFVRNHLRRGVKYSKHGGGGGSGADGADSEQDPTEKTDYVREFTRRYLRVDGVFLLRLIAHNTNGITTTEITRELWDLWYDKRQKEMEANETTSLKEDRAAE